MIGIPIPPIAHPQAGAASDVLVAVLAMLIMGIALIAFAIWGSRELRRSETVEDDVTAPMALPNAA